MNQILIGDEVKLIGIPDWLVHDLPKDEGIAIVACIGKTAKVESIDNYGYYWIGFGCTTETTNGSEYEGHSFGVPLEFLEKI
jgi:hypothetical protein